MEKLIIEERKNYDEIKVELVLALVGKNVLAEKKAKIQRKNSKKVIQHLSKSNTFS